MAAVFVRLGGDRILSRRREVAVGEGADRDHIRHAFFSADARFDRGQPFSKALSRV